LTIQNGNVLHGFADEPFKPEIVMGPHELIPCRFIEVDIRQALTYSERLGVYAYDAYFIEVAKQQQCPLLSLDRGLLHAAREAGVEVMEVII